MLIHGKERKLKLTVGASAEIAELCPDGDLGRLGEILKEKYSLAISKTAKIIAAMSRGYEDSRAFDEPEYTPEPITEKEILCLTPKEFSELRTEMWAAFDSDAKTTVKVAPSKKKEAEAEST